MKNTPLIAPYPKSSIVDSKVTRRIISPCTTASPPKKTPASKQSTSCPTASPIITPRSRTIPIQNPATQSSRPPTLPFKQLRREMMHPSHPQTNQLLTAPWCLCCNCCKCAGCGPAGVGNWPKHCSARSAASSRALLTYCPSYQPRA
jgi:hypothetical protein